ncbi:hypothetical protein Tco_0434758 [Tanacetum coccineum]
MADVMSDLECMPYNEIMSMSEGDEDSDTSKVLSPQDEYLADDSIEESINLKATSHQKLRHPMLLVSMYLKESQKLIHVEHIIDVQELAAKLSDMEGKTCVKKQATNQYLSLVKKIGFHGIAANIHNTGNKMDFLPEQLNSTLDYILPRFMVDSQEGLRKMLFDGFLISLLILLLKHLSWSRRL